MKKACPNIASNNPKKYGLLSEVTIQATTHNRRYSFNPKTKVMEKLLGWNDKVEIWEVLIKQ